MPATYSKSLVAYFKWAAAPGDCPDSELPAEFRAARADLKGAPELLTPFLKATFCAQNLSELETMLASMDDVQGEEVEVLEVRFDDQNTPTIKADAVFTLPFTADVDGDDIEEWEEEVDDTLASCVTFYWSFGKEADNLNGWNGWLLEHESSSMQLLDDESDDDE